MARRFMTEDELLAALEDARRRESDAEARYRAAQKAAAEPERLANEAENRAMRAKTAATKAVAGKEAAERAEMALPLVRARDEAGADYMEARQYTDELRRETPAEWRRVREAFNEPRDVARLAAPCPVSPDGSHSLRTGSMHAPKDRATGVSLHCQHCHARVAIAESQVVRLILEALVSGGALRELPKLVSTTDE
jgi:hypothetical protein